MFKRTCVERRLPCRGKRFSRSPSSDERGRTSTHGLEAPVRRATSGSPSTSARSSEHSGGKLPTKCLVSTTAPRRIPGRPRRMTHQSCPGSRRRRVSHPSIHLPESVYSPSRKTGAPGLSRFSRPAKNSSLAASAVPRSLSEARSTSSLKSVIENSSGQQDLSCRREGKLSAVVDLLTLQVRRHDDA